MYCPQCGQERISEATSFCSRCGYLLTGTAELLKFGGVPLASAQPGTPSPRSRGVRQGLFMFLLMFLIAPIIGIISVFAFRTEPWPMGIIIFLLGGGGLLRIAYALMFQAKYPGPMSERSAPGELNPAVTSALPPRRQEYVSPTRPTAVPETAEIPPSVTERTTRLLEKETED